ncbi:MAG: glycosyltransferase family 39 protein [Acidobacteriota bacterium]
MSLIKWRLLLRRFRRWIVVALATRQTTRARTKLILALLIFALAFAVRSLHAVDLAALMYTTEQPFNGLTEGYDLRAVSILRGEGVLGPYNIDTSDTKWLTQAPGYSIFLGGVYAILGRDFFKPQLVQNAVNSLSAVLIFLIAGSLISWRVGAVAGVLAALSHHLAHISNFILPDAMHALPVLAAIYFLVIARRAHHSYWLYAAAGLMIGLGSWLRAQTMLLGLFLVVMLAMINTRRWLVVKRVAVTAIISLVAIAPITIRNYVVYGEFIPIQVGLGILLWEGIGDASGDRFGAVKQDTEVATQEAELYGDPRYAGSWTTPDGIKRDRDRTKRSLGIVVRYPIWYAGVMMHRCGEMLKYSAHAPLVLTVSQARSAQRSAPIKRVWSEITPDDSSLAVGESIFWMRPVVRGLQRIAKETMLGFIIIGAIILFAASWRRAMFISIVPLYYFLFQSAMHTEFRYTLPMQYFVFVFAATVWVLICVGVPNVIKSFSDRKVNRAPAIH